MNSNIDGVGPNGFGSCNHRLKYQASASDIGGSREMLFSTTNALPRSRNLGGIAGLRPALSPLRFDHLGSLMVRDPFEKQG